jgi:hypothetical protein
VLFIAFASASLRAVCEDAPQAESVFGPAVAQALRHRLADFRAATSTSDLIAGSPRARNDQEFEYMTINLRDGFQMRFIANHIDNPRDAQGKIDWSRVRKFQIFEIAI